MGTVNVNHSIRTFEPLICKRHSILIVTTKKQSNFRLKTSFGYKNILVKLIFINKRKKRVIISEMGSIQHLITTNVCSGALPFLLSGDKPRTIHGFAKERGIASRSLYTKEISTIFPRKRSCNSIFKKLPITVPRSGDSSNSDGANDDSSEQAKKPFGYSRKDVLLIGLGVTVAGIGLESGLEYVGVDPLQAGNVVQLVLVLGLTIGWISTYIFRVSNKEMTYVQQLRDYEDKVMQKRLDGLNEAELEALLEQVEEDKRRLATGKKVK